MVVVGAVAVGLAGRVVLVRAVGRVVVRAASRRHCVGTRDGHGRRTVGRARQPGVFRGLVGGRVRGWGRRRRFVFLLLEHAGFVEEVGDGHAVELVLRQLIGRHVSFVTLRTFVVIRFDQCITYTCTQRLHLLKIYQNNRILHFIHIFWLIYIKNFFLHSNSYWKVY